MLEQPVVNELPLNALELEVVIVITELKSRRLCTLTGFVEQLGDLLEAFRVSKLLVDPRADEIMMADYVGVIDDLVPFLSENRKANVRGRRRQAVSTENIAD